jgi:hypothetical protein
MGNMSHARVPGISIVNLKLTLEKTTIEERATCSNHKKNLVSGSLLCREGFKLVFESNKCVLSKYEFFVGKAYKSRGLFHLSLLEECNNVVNNVMNIDESIVWHSWLCYINFGCMAQLANLSLLPKFTLVKGSKCQVCVESKQPYKPH